MFLEKTFTRNTILKAKKPIVIKIVVTPTDVKKCIGMAKMRTTKINCSKIVNEMKNIAIKAATNTSIQRIEHNKKVIWSKPSTPKKISYAAAAKPKKINPLFADDTTSSISTIKRKTPKKSMFALSSQSRTVIDFV